MGSSGSNENLETSRIGADLLAATESIHEALLGGGELESLTAAYQTREAAFEALRAIVGGEDGQAVSLDAATRAYVERVRTLDREILEVCGAEVTAIRDERNSLNRRRSAIQAHATRERLDARVFEVKA